MVFQVKSNTEIFKVPNIDGTPNVYFAEILGTQNSQMPSPIVGCWFRMEKGPESTPPKYEYDEAGVVLEGEINIRDESGQTATIKAGDTFFFPRGSTITFSSDRYGIAWKCGGRLLSKL